jgi:hypothetical protein
MHVPTPHLHKKAEKRKASLDSVAHSDDADAPPAPVVEKKTMKCKKKAKMNKAKKEKSHTPEPRAVTPLSASPVPVAVADQPTSPHTTTAQRTPHESYVPPPPHTDYLPLIQLTHSPTASHPPQLQTSNPKPLAAAPASRNPSAASVRSGINVARTLSASTARLCRWSRRGRRRIIRGMGWGWIDQEETGGNMSGEWEVEEERG